MNDMRGVNFTDDFDQAHREPEGIKKIQRSAFNEPVQGLAPEVLKHQHRPVPMIFKPICLYYSAKVEVLKNPVLVFSRSDLLCEGPFLGKCFENDFLTIVPACSEYYGSLTFVDRLMR